ncbi:unnamed protein product [Clavelina lepadiformis]|uniref:Uncharacterized protein n=1 Tax=Clavelina lepadiformis TaxID=159417 RepID=A0ABP0F2W2_CLALP
MESESKERSFIETALKHHSSAQAAIKVLQEQLSSLKKIQSTKKETFILTNEQDLEKSAADILYSASHFLHDSVDGKPIVASPFLSSTLSVHGNVKDDGVIRNLLPSFEDIKNNKKLIDIEKIVSVSPIKPSYSEITSLTPVTKDSLASTTLPLTPFSFNISTPKSMHAIDPEVNEQISSSVNCLHLTPQFSTQNMNLTEILEQLAYSSTLSGHGPEHDRVLNTSDTDELIQLLEKISQAGKDLKFELQEAKLQESKLKEEVASLRTKENGVSRKSEWKSSEDCKGFEEKCTKLEDALLSLQDENIKLNRMLKDRGETSQNESFEKMKDENHRLKIQVEQLKQSLADNEKKLQGYSTNMVTRTGSPEKKAKQQQLQNNHVDTQLRNKLDVLEGKLYDTISEVDEVKKYQKTIDDLHILLLEKDEKIKSYERQLKALCKKYGAMHTEYELLQEKDVYKRKEVLQLCDKFERMKAKYKKLESELTEYRTEDQRDNTCKWALENSIQKLTQENYSLRAKILSEEKQMSMSKMLLEKDYEALKMRYDGLLLKISQSDYDKNSFPKQIVHPTKEVQLNTSILSATPYALDASGDPARSRSYHKLGSPNFTSTIRRQRRHTSPWHLTLPENIVSRQPNGLRVRSDSDVHYLNHSWNSGNLKAVPKATNVEGGDGLHLSTGQNVTGVSPLTTTELYTQGFETPFSKSPILKQQNLSSYPLRKNFGHHRRSFSLSPVDVQSRAKSAFNFKKNISVHSQNASEQSAVKRDEQTGREISVTEQEATKNKLCFSSEVLSSTPLCTSSHHHKRSHTTPNVSLTDPKSNYFLEGLGIRYGQSAYSKEYLKNMDGVRLVVNLSNHTDKKELKKTNEQHNESSLTGILKQANCNASFAHEKSSSVNFGLPQQESTQLEDITKHGVLSHSKSTEYDSASKSVLGESTLREEKCWRSLHLSDLPCDQTAVYDKFRNFHSHVTDYKNPPMILQNDVIEDDKKTIDNANTLRKMSAASERSYLQKQRDFPLAVKEDMDTAEQSSASTTRDHIGRVEFLRQIQINTGVRMPGLMHNITLKDDVILDDSDMKKEIKLGLSDNQQAYAEKLVKKYTKKGGKRKHDVLQKKI